MTDNERRKQKKIARLLADWDGCEGADLLVSLSEWATHAQDGHGYAFSDKTEGFIRQALQAEIDEQLKWIDDAVAQGIHDQEEADELRAAIAKLDDLS